MGHDGPMDWFLRKHLEDFLVIFPAIFTGISCRCSPMICRIFTFFAWKWLVIGRVEFLQLGCKGNCAICEGKNICGLVPKLRIYMHLLCWVLNTELVMYPIICWTKGIHSEVRKKSGGKHDLVDSKNGRTLFLVFYMWLCVWLALLKSKNVRWKYQKQHGDEMWNGKINGINAGYFMQWKPSVHFVQSDASCFQ